MAKSFDWQEIEPHFTELAVIMGRDFCHWSDIMTFPVSQHGADELQDLIRVLTQMRSHIEDTLAPFPEVRYNANDTQQEQSRHVYSGNRKRNTTKRQRITKETVGSGGDVG